MHAKSVHPRVCGEQASVGYLSDFVCGSSPRVRGTGIENLISKDPNRFIPACAGNSHRLVDRYNQQPVHPRVCGEQDSIRRVPLSLVGSSPRVRGTAHFFWGSTNWKRFIPACAGNSKGKTSCRASQSVHPRVCGEQSLSVSTTSSPFGSSPRVRGTGPSRSTISDSQRFIPACAGNRATRGDCRPPSPVHPRVCGEQDGSEAGISR